MQHVEWSQKYSVRIKLVDSQHQELFENLNKLSDALESGSTDLVRESFGNLVAGKRRHFADEERLLAKFGYPGLQKQKSDHDKLLKKLQEIQRRSETDPSAINEELLIFMEEWLSSHILGADQAYGEFLKGCGVS